MANEKCMSQTTTCVAITPISKDLASENKTEAVIAQYDWLLSLK